MEPCPHCSGSGKEPCALDGRQEGDGPCHMCNGAKKVTQERIHQMLLECQFGHPPP